VRAANRGNARSQAEMGKTAEDSVKAAVEDSVKAVEDSVQAAMTVVLS
jgi:hypothetical protein